ncbi:MAG: pseudouridine synthase [Bacteroidales bacterium]|nr:pseudouridine synthase [Bacteroidales bacterium]
MDQFTKEGRKLRPRKTAGPRPSSEKVEYTPGAHRSEGEHRSNNYEHRSYGEGRPQRPYGESRGNGGEHRSNYGGGRSGGYGNRDNNRYGNRDNHGFSGRGGYGENRGGYGERRSYGDRDNREGGERRNNYGENRSYGESRGNYGDRRPRSYGEGRSNYGENRGGYNAGPRKPMGGKPKGKKPGRKPNFTRESTEGINRMISRRPVVNGSESTETPYPMPIQDTVRLNKFIANSGVCSRREADTLIQAGVVTVNGEVVTELGTKVNIFTDDIRFNGERLKGEEKVYIVMNKPKGFVTTASDPHAEKTVVDLVKNCPTRVYPVGRLDKNTTGVLMLTNDGEIAERLTHPSYDKKKIYQVALDRPLSQEDFDKILAGIELTDGVVQADELEYIDEKDKRKLGIEIHSGKNRIVRRIFETLGYNVKALDRVYFAGLTKKGLKKGEWRYLTEGETNILKMGAYV